MRSFKEFFRSGPSDEEKLEYKKWWLSLTWVDLKDTSVYTRTDGKVIAEVKNIDGLYHVSVDFYISYTDRNNLGKYATIEAAKQRAENFWSKP